MKYLTIEAREISKFLEVSFTKPFNDHESPKRNLVLMSVTERNNFLQRCEVLTCSTTDVS